MIMSNNLIPCCCPKNSVTNATWAEVDILMTAASFTDVNVANTEHCKSPRATSFFV